MKRTDYLIFSSGLQISVADMIHKGYCVGIGYCLTSTDVLSFSFPVWCVNLLVFILRVLMLDREQILTLRTCFRIIPKNISFNHITQEQCLEDHELLILKPSEIQVCKLYSFSTIYAVIGLILCHTVSGGEVLNGDHLFTILKERSCVTFFIQLHYLTNQCVLGSNLQITEDHLIQK